MDYKDYYSTLGVSKSATKTDIQKAYRKLARKYHPDVNKKKGAEARFKEINEAHEVLKDPEKRARYDQFGSAWTQSQRTGGAPPPGFEDIFSTFTSGHSGPQAGFGGMGGGGFSSFFDMLFGSDPRSAGPRRPPHTQGPWGTGGGFAQTGPQGGQRHDARLALSLSEAARGGAKDITVTDPTTGRRRTLRVTIPKGVQPGQRIRLAGQGGPGTAGSPKGDLYLTVDLLPDPRFRLEESDLHVAVNVTPWVAALGGQARVSTLEGDVTIKVPPGSSSGRKIRLRGKGFPEAGGGTGDLFAEIRIAVPDPLTDRERELFESLATESEFEPGA